MIGLARVRIDRVLRFQSRHIARRKYGANPDPNSPRRPRAVTYNSVGAHTHTTHTHARAQPVL
jgi:hypothetical protein